ncbi:HAUS augmin-like complex subunit 6 N-terminus-domain-containing protein [Aspergillus avenaceus]|uniref:HAUS augmin-like complex subunit 6 N-terminus-domain-containing protein n=1 Tax=Aspergillus avenaceus TaxID=36643 RepID=A0A5N6U852_ASPAV|nr:HAUS augmin-like complex subunit 6 N-terminus-domain-containing protein [Aspergillus avenaceus]
MQSNRPPSRHKSSDWIPQPPLAVFIRNLRLLQLDTHDDWPDISASSLSPSSQNQRQRIKTIEWALYHLVVLWDPETARDKLRPFFPPLEPLQSVNLRSALFRVLSEVKKKGEMGKDTILRKSMLDDCKGDKFDELLAIFSTAVLRKALIASGDDGLENPAIKLSMAPGLTQEDYELLRPLILAHRVSLKTVAERRHKAQVTHEKFSQLLDHKKRQLLLHSKENRPELTTVADFESLAQEVQANWLGSLEWADSLLYGGARNSNDTFLELPFSAAWSKAKESTVEDLKTSSTPDLLVDLENRVTQQRARLQRWHQYHSSMQKHERADSANIMNGPILPFRDHQALTVASISKAVRQPVERISPKADDRSLLFSMTESLARINGTHRSTSRTAPLPVSAGNTDCCSRERKPTSPSRAPSPPIIREDPCNPSSGDASSEETERSNSPSIHVSSQARSRSPPRRERDTLNLVERTRKSMSLLPPTKPWPRESLQPRRPRSSFPVNQFDVSEGQTPEISRASTPRDELFEEEADYARVFKSRPRVAHSPISSPAVHVGPVDSFDLGMDIESRQDMNGEYGFESPSAGRRR